MLEFYTAGGWIMHPLFFCLIVASAIIGERFWVLQAKRISPTDVTDEILHWLRNDQIDNKKIHKLYNSSPLGQILAAGLMHRNSSRDATREAIEDIGRHVAVTLERNLNTLGTIAAISPLLGLLGTVIGMIKVFAVITTEGVGNPNTLAGGISEALLTTAFGLMIAIPSVIFYRHFKAKINNLIIHMEQEAIKLVDILHSNKDSNEDAKL